MKIKNTMENVDKLAVPLLYKVVLLSFASIGFSACNGPGSMLTKSEVNPPVNTVQTPVPAPPFAPSPTPSLVPTPAPSPSSPTADLYKGPTEVEKYVNKFVDDGKIQGIDVTQNFRNPKLEIKIGSLESYGSSVIGLCELGTQVRRVTLSPDFWNTGTESQRELLMHHELGHCVLSRLHRSDKLSSGEVASIMYPVIMADKTYTGNYTYYQNELFTWNASTLKQEEPRNPVVHVCDKSILYGDH